MNLYVIIGLILCLFIGFVGGMAVAQSVYEHCKVGKLRIDDSTGDTYLFLELGVPIETILDQKTVVMEVDLSPITRE